MEAARREHESSRHLTEGGGRDGSRAAVVSWQAATRVDRAVSGEP